MKSLLIASTYFPPQTGGISRMMEEICVALGPERVTCLTGVPAGDTDHERLQPAQVFRRPSAFANNRVMQALPLACSIGAIALRDRPRIVQLSTCDDGYVGLWLQRWLKLPFVVYAHGNEILSAIESDWEKPRLALRSAACVLANSRFTAGLLRGAGVRPEAIKIIPLGCDVEKFRPRDPDPDLRKKLLGPRAGGRVILTVGNLVERKGHDMVIRALPEICRTASEVTYLIVGDGTYRKRLEEIALEAGVRDRVVFAGKVPDEELAKCYSLCDVFAMPSRARLDARDIEGFGLVFLEANACGKAVVAGRSGGIEDAVVDGRTGLLVDPSDPRDIARAVLRLLSDDRLRGALGTQGHDRVQREYTWKIFGERVQGILVEAAEAPRLGSARLHP